MGAACCVALKGKTVTNGSPGDSLQRHAHYSPSWSFRWDNRGRVAGEEAHSNSVHDGGFGIGRTGAKFGTSSEAAFASEEGSSVGSFRSIAWQKTSSSEGNDGTLSLQYPDPSISQNIAEAKESDSQSISDPSLLKLSPSIPSVSSMSGSPLSSRSHLFPPRHRIPKSPSFSISEEPSLYNGGSSGSWSVPASSELVTTRRERWSFDSETSVFSRDKIMRYSGHISGSPSFDVQTCGVCTKLLTDRSSLGLGNHKIMYTNTLGVVSVLTCGHVYHSECLEYMTPEINKYDPVCPVCTFGEKRVMKMMSEKARKRSRKRVTDSDLSSNEIITFDDQRSGGLKPSSSSGVKGLRQNPFLRRHFSFGSKASSRSFSDSNQSTPRRGLFWARSSKE